MQAGTGPGTEPRQYHPNMPIEEWQRAIGLWAYGKGWWDNFPGGDVTLDIAWQREAHERHAEMGLAQLHLASAQVDLDLNTANYIAAKLCLIHSEASEGLEALRDGDLVLRIDPETGKPEGLESELADILIRTLDLANALGMDMGKTMVAKMSYNEGRPYKHGGRKL